ncbi:hypothetical protein KY284_036216 [Solanum tuberosum]|nr:hypothetical protein KY284_036216 [Solanum tuberosum]
MDRNPLVSDKDDMQINISWPPSIDQVMKHTETTEKGSPNPKKHKFESVDMSDHRDDILRWMNELWNKWRGHLHAKYMKDKLIQQSLRNIPRGVDKKEWEWLVKEHFASESFQARSSRNAANSAKLTMLHHIGSKPIRERKDGNLPDLATIFFETRKKDNKLLEPEAIEKHRHLVQLKEIVQVDPSLPSIEIVEKCCGPQTRSHDNKSLNEANKFMIEENKSLNDRLSTLENEMKEIMKMKEIFAAQQSHVQASKSFVSTE